MSNKIFFSETQRFTQWWLWLILLCAMVMPFYSIYKSLQNPSTGSNTGIIISLLIMVPVIALTLLLRLETKITDVGISVRFFPFHLKSLHFSWSEMEQTYVREYSPLGEFGGWGLRYGLNGKAYNVSGNQGIQLVFKNGEKLLIGTNKPEEAKAVLKQIQEVAK